MKIKLYIALFAAAVAGINAKAQTAITEDFRIINGEKHVWQSSRNAAGMGLMPTTEIGVVQIGGYGKKGDYHSSQEGNRMSHLGFNTEKYSTVNDNLYLFGKFSFAREDERNRSWNDVINPNDGNPYIYGSPYPGRYLRQLIDLHTGISSRRIGNFYFGIGGQYHVADQSRLNDPRPRTTLANYSIIPSVIWEFASGHSLGFDTYYRFNKEYMTSISIKQKSVKLDYYDFMGLENARLIPTTTFKRNIKSYYWGADMQYGFNGGGIVWLTNINYQLRSDAIYDTSNGTRAEPGNYKTITLGADTKLRWGGDKSLNSLNANFEYIKGFADFYRQERHQLRDDLGNVSSWWATVYKAVYYKNLTHNGGVEYKYYATNENGGFNWFVGGAVKYSGFEDKYILPASSRVKNFVDYSLKGGARIIKFNNNSSLYAGVSLGYTDPTKYRLDLNSSTIIAENIIVPDMAIFSKKAYSGQAELRYDFTIKSKTDVNKAFFKIYGGQVRNEDKLHMNNVGFTLGMLLK